MDNLIWLGAYVIIILIIGSASVIKKYLANRQLRIEREKQQGKALRIEPEPAAQPTQPKPVTVERIPEPEPTGMPLSLDDVLKKILTRTDERPVPMAQRETEEPTTLKPVSVPYRPERTELTKAEYEPKYMAEEVNGWNYFTDGLKEKGLTEIQRAVILADVFGAPIVRKQRRLIPYQR
jgi:hypothetical protein